MMYLIRSKLSVVAIVSIAVVAVAFSLYYYSYLNYAQLTLKQLHSSTILTTMPFTEVSKETINSIPKLNQAFNEVAIKYDRVTQDCPPEQLVFCDIPSATKYTTNITSDEYESLSQVISFNASESSDDALQAYLKYRCLHDNLADGTFEEYCYYVMEIEQ